MESYKNAVATVNALVDKIKAESNYDDLLRRNSYTTGYLTMMLIELCCKSEDARKVIDFHLNGEA